MLCEESNQISPALLAATEKVSPLEGKGVPLHALAFVANIAVHCDGVHVGVRRGGHEPGRAGVHRTRENRPHARHDQGRRRIPGSQPSTVRR
jgi:hypothetical protein